MESRKESKIHLTNEILTKNFKSNFDLVNYAIQLAKTMIKTGHESRFSEVQNRAMSVLKEIEEGRDILNFEGSVISQESRISHQESLDNDALESNLLVEEQVHTRNNGSKSFSADEEE